MGVDQQTNRLRFFLFFSLFAVFCFGQQNPPFLEKDTRKTREYQQLLQEILVSKYSAIEKVEERIKLASIYKEQEEVLAALEEKLILKGETAKLRYLIAGTNGIIALQQSKIFSIPYVKSMLKNFERSIQLDASFLPSYEAYTEALCMVPSLLGGDVKKAKYLASKLEQLSPVDGYFAQGYIANSQALESEARAKYKQAFDLLLEIDFCMLNLTNFFASRSMNFPYKISAVSVHYDIAPSVGICAIDYFIDNQNVSYNLPLEWAYFRKAQLHKRLDQNAKAYQSISQALEINSNFTLAKQFKQTHWNKK